MKKYAIGIMSGTSLDGIDIVLATIKGESDNTECIFIDGKTYPYQTTIIDKLQSMITEKTCTIEDICSVHFLLAKEYADCVKQFCIEQNILLEDITFVASHGQTIYHIDKTSGSTPSSLQIGDGSVLANLLQTTVVSNFRSADIAVGGNGAPLVPYADYILFHNAEKARCFQNIGGIANVTYLPKTKSLDHVIAFDNGPGNVWINHMMMELYNKPYDEDGSIAKSGQVIDALLHDILSHEYFSLPIPKSTGRELFTPKLLQEYLQPYNDAKKEDIIATLTHVTAKSIVQSYHDFLPQDINEIYVSGGGAYNKTLLSLIQHYAYPISVYPLEHIGYSSSYKEALAFIILANETLHYNTANVPSATGANKQVILGQVSFVKKEVTQ